MIRQKIQRVATANSNMKCDWKTKSLFTLSLLAASHAVGASYSYGPVAYPAAGTGDYTDIDGILYSDYKSFDWSGVSLVVEKFNSSLGELQSVSLLFKAEVAGSGGAENWGEGAATITFKLAADLSLKKPDGSAIITLNLSDTSYSKECTAYDGTTDYGGTSGLKVENYTVIGQGGTALTLASDLQLFIGEGTISLPVSAIGRSGFSGSGNMLVQVQSGGKASVTVTYSYAPVPEPSSAGLATGIGLIGLTGWRRTRRLVIKPTWCKRG